MIYRENARTEALYGRLSAVGCFHGPIMTQSATCVRALVRIVGSPSLIGLGKSSSLFVQNRCWSSVDGLREQIHPVSAYWGLGIKCRKPFRPKTTKIKPSTMREMMAIYFIGLSRASEAVFLDVHRDCVCNLAHHLGSVSSARLSPT